MRERALIFSPSMNTQSQPPNPARGDEPKAGPAGAELLQVLSITIHDSAGRPKTAVNLTTREASVLLGSPRILQRLRHHGWLVPLQASRDALYPVCRVFAVQRRMQAGEMPGLLPCEQRERERRSTQLKSA